MKNIITALQSPNIGYMLQEKKMCNVVTKDIQYQEGIIEILEKQKNIEIIFIKESLPGKLPFIQFIGKIKNINSKIEIIVFVTHINEELRKLLHTFGIYKIYEENEISLETIEKLIYKEREESILEEIEKLKEMLNQRNQVINKNVTAQKKKVKEKKIELNKKMVVSICGTYSAGKTTMAMLLGYAGFKNKIKTIVIDFDIFHKGITSIKDKKINKQETLNLKNTIIHNKQNADLLCGINNFFNMENKFTEEKLEKILEELKMEYDLIIIDTSSEIQYGYVKLLLNKADKVIFLIEPNLIQLKISEELLKIYVENWYVDKNKINIVINKNMSCSISLDIIRKIFQKYPFLNVIPFRKEYNVLINNHFHFEIMKKAFLKTQNKILQKICST